MVEHEIELEIPFHDVDMLQVAWHGHYVRYLELARCALLDRIGYGYRAMFDSGYAWPVVDLRLRYVQAAEFGDRIRVRARVVETEFRLKIDYLITRAATAERLTRASSVQVAVTLADREICYPAPTILAERVQAAGGLS